MFAATRKWFRRNRTPIAIGLGVVGAGYVVTSYVLGKLRDARERLSSDRIAKENLRRRFEQNQEDCTFTVLALLPTATANILEAMNTEKITYEIQQIKGSAAARVRSVGSTSPPSTSGTAANDDDSRSIITVSALSEAGVQTTTLSAPTPLTPAGPDSGAAEPAQDKPQAPPKPPKTKRQLWDDLTISAVARAYTLLYTLALLTMLTRIQLNLLGRRSYLSSVVVLASGGTSGAISLENNDDDSPEHAYGTDFEVNRKYLTFSWWLLNRGWVDVMRRVEGAVRQVFGHLSPRDAVTLDTFERLTRDVRRLVEGSPASTGAGGPSWLPFLLPPADMEDFVLRESGVLHMPSSNEPGQPADRGIPNSPSPSTPSPAASLRRLLDETSDLVESPAFSHVLAQLLDAGFSVLLHEKLSQGAFEPVTATTTAAAAAAAAPTTTTTTSTTTTTTTATGTPPSTAAAIPLPKILSVLARQAHAIGHGMPNEYLQAMESVPDLEGFAAVVYSSNWQAEIAGEAAADGGGGGGGDVAGEGRGQGVGEWPTRSGPGTGPTRRLAESSGSVVVVDAPSGGEAQSSLFDSVWERASRAE